MNPDDFQKLYMAELSEMRSTEAQMAKSLITFADRATDPGLSEAIRVHAEETAKHRDLLDDLMTDHGARPDSHSDASMKTLISEADKWSGMVEDETLRDAGLIASLQRMEHYEMAVLGTLVSWADRLGHSEDAEVLSAILYDDKEADAAFSRIAKTAVNPTAV